MSNLAPLLFLAEHYETSYGMMLKTDTSAYFQPVSRFSFNCK